MPEFLLMLINYADEWTSEIIKAIHYVRKKQDQSGFKISHIKGKGKNFYRSYKYHKFQKQYN